MKKLFTPVRRRKGMIDLTMQGREDWFAKSIQEANEKDERLKTLLRKDDSELEDMTYELPDWVYMLLNLI